MLTSIICDILEKTGNQYDPRSPCLSCSITEWLSPRRHRLTLNNRGGMIGDREVNISFIAARIKSASPTQRRAIVLADDPLSRISK